MTIEECIAKLTELAEKYPGIEVAMESGITPSVSYEEEGGPDPMAGDDPVIIFSE